MCVPQYFYASIFYMFKLVFYEYMTPNSPFQDAILRYNTAHAKKWDFTALNLLCTEVSFPKHKCYLFSMGWYWNNAGRLKQSASSVLTIPCKQNMSQVCFFEHEAYDIWIQCLWWGTSFQETLKHLNETSFNFLRFFNWQDNRLSYL